MVRRFLVLLLAISAAGCGGGDAADSTGAGGSGGGESGGAGGETGGGTGGMGGSGGVETDAGVNPGGTGGGEAGVSGVGGEEADAGAVEAGADDADLPPTGEPFQGDLTAMGPHVVVEQTVSVPAQSGSLQGGVYAPAEAAGEGEPFPLVIVVPGFMASYTSYSTYSQHMASWGFVVVGINFTNPGDHPQSAADILDTIDWAASGGIPPEAALPSRVDATRVATAGHSAGGKIAYFAASLDPERIKAVVGWDPVNTGGPPCGIAGAPDDPNAPCNANPVAPNPTAGQAGVMDSMTAAALTFGAPVSMFNPAEHHAEHFFQGSKSPAMYVFFVNGAHTNWGVGPAAVEEGICKPSGVAWLLRHLRGLQGPGIDAHLPPISTQVTVDIK